VLEKDSREIRNEEAVLMRRQWTLYLQRTGISGVRTINAVLPHLDAWMDRTNGEIGFRLTQLLAGHGCFGSYLSRIQKVETAECEHCGSGQVDSVEHSAGLRGVDRREGGIVQGRRQ